jgi:superfamily II DNA or RNA helicase
LNASENSSEQALILVDKLEHGLYIQQAGIAAGISIPVVCGRTNDAQIKKLGRHGAFRENSVVIDDVDAVEEFRAAFGRGEHRVAIGTAALMTGADFPRLSFGVYASSMTTTIAQQQSAGRQMRRSPGKEHATMIDFYDVFCPRAFDRTKTRIRNARSEGWNVEIVE